MADGSPIPLRPAPASTPAARPEDVTEAAVAGLVTAIRLLALIAAAELAVIAALILAPVPV